MNNVRKFITTPEGSGALYGLVAMLVGVFGMHFSLPIAVLYSLFAGYVGGYKPLKQLTDNGDYFITNIQQDRHEVTKRFKKLLRKNQLPENKAEHAEFAIFLNATEQRHNKNIGNKIGFPIGCFVFFIVMTVGIGEFTVVGDWFLLITIVITFLYIRERSTPQKIAALREKLDATVQQ